MPICSRCYKRWWIAKVNQKTGLQVINKTGDLIYKCVNCDNEQAETNPFKPVVEKVKANILYIDIEKSKSLYFNYGRKVQSKYLNINDLVKEPFMISWSASYIDNPRVWSKIVTPEQAVAWDDSQIVRRLHDLMMTAEIIAGHNVDGFDLKNCNTRFKENGLIPIVGKKTIDTLKLARKHYAYESNTLDYICGRLGINGKDKITNEDWIKALSGDEKVLRKIHRYNRHDVINGKAVLVDMEPLINKKAAYGARKSEPITIDDKIEDVLEVLDEKNSSHS